VVAVAAVVAVVVVSELPGSSQGASKPPASAGAATVQRRNLVQTDTESGTLGYASPQTVYNRLNGTITWLPTVGQQVKTGQTLFKVDDKPVVLFDGTTPAYRTLSPSVSDGPDVLELNQNLVNLGFDNGEPITVNDTWQAATTDAVERWRGSLGETETGTVTLGQVVFLPGAQVVSSVSTVLGSTGGGSGGGSSAGSSGSSGASGNSGASLETGAPKPEFVSLTQSTTTPRSSKPRRKRHRTSKSSPSNAELLALIKLLQAEIAEMQSSHSSAGSRSSSAAASRPSSSSSSSGSRSSPSGSPSNGSASSSSGSSGSGAAPADPVLQTTSTQKVVTVQLDATKQSEAVTGERVSVELPDGTTVGGRISQVSSVAQSSSNSSSGAGGGGGGGGSGSESATIPVTIALTGHRRINGLDQAAVSVNFVQQRANNVLSVPVTALIATQGGNYALQEVTAPHSLIPVTPGLFAAGYVQVSGPGIYEGLQVTDSQG
jgi:hypothetical protein